MRGVVTIELDSKVTLSAKSGLILGENKAAFRIESHIICCDHIREAICEKLGLLVRVLIICPLDGRTIS